MRHGLSFSTSRIGRYAAAGLILGMLSGHALAQQTYQEDEREDHAALNARWYDEYSNPTREADFQAKRLAGLRQLRTMANPAAMKVSSSGAWIPVGSSASPNGKGGYVSGRCASICEDSAGTIYLGTMQGGLWMSLDHQSTPRGVNWKCLSDSWASLGVGGVAVDPVHQNIIYAGTGAAMNTPAGQGNNSGDVAGVGIYKSTDGGNNWRLLPNSSGTVTTGLLINPANPNLIYHSTVVGVFLSTDSGASWKLSSGPGGYGCTIVDPINPAILYSSGNGTIAKSTDSGKTWSKLSGFTAGGSMPIAISRANHDYIYLSSSTLGSGTNGGAVLSRSTDAGATWIVLSNSETGGPRYLGDQGYYANAVAVNPNNAENVTVGGLDIYGDGNGGTALSQLTDWSQSNTSNTNFTHADIHYLGYIGDTLVTLSDGGCYFSPTNGSTWSQAMNQNLGTFQWVGGDSYYANGKLEYFFAGAQDNGVDRLDTNNAYWFSIHGGDGGRTFVGQDNDGKVVYSTYINANGTTVLYRSEDRGISFKENILDLSPILGDLPRDVYTEYDVCETSSSAVAVVGGNNVYMTLTAQNASSGISNPADNFPSITTGSIVRNPHCVHIGKADPNYVFIGASSGMYWSWDGGSTWNKPSKNVSGMVTSITTRSNDPEKVYLTVAGSSGRHFYLSTDHGDNWTAPAVTTGPTALPSLNFRQVAVDNDGDIFLGTDGGVVYSTDNGVNWYPMGTNFPNVLVTSLRVRGHYVVVSTYGRGMYYFDIDQLPLRGVNPATAPSSVASIGYVFPNPVTTSAVRSTNISYSLAHDGPTMIAIHDVLGRQERVTMNAWATAGEHVSAANLSDLPVGQHYIVLTTAGTSVTKPITIE